MASAGDLDGALRAYGLGGPAVRGARALDPRRARARGRLAGPAARLGQGLVRIGRLPRTTRYRCGSLLGTTSIALDLQLVSTVPHVVHGDRGLDAKGAAAGNASYYYSIPRLAADGSVTIEGETFAVTGLAWLDREWSTSALEPGVVGWDWFALHLVGRRQLDVLSPAHGERRGHGFQRRNSGRVRRPTELGSQRATWC